MRSRLFNEVSQKHSVFVAAESSKTEGAWVEVTADVYFPSGNQTWQWKIHHLSMVFLLNPPISSGIYEPFVILGGFFFGCVRQARTSAAFIVARETGDLLRQRRLGGLVSVR
jgi:hypothetical protein